MARHQAGMPPSTGRSQGCRPIAATASRARRRRWLPDTADHAGVVRVRAPAGVPSLCLTQRISTRPGPCDTRPCGSCTRSDGGSRHATGL
jgi:hypothetical protein